MTNRDRFQQTRQTTIFVCEYSPERDGRAHITDPYHGDAEFESHRKNGWRLCRECRSLPRFADVNLKPMYTKE